MKNYLNDLKNKILLKWYERKYVSKNNEQTFTYIYNNNVWGKFDKNNEFYSGTGSHKKEIIIPYINLISKFLKDKNLRVLDLGCGDFNIGKNFTEYSKEYIAADIVSELIDYNKIKFNNHKNLTFLKLDLTLDKLPNVDVILIRQVLMHLSNENIIKFIKNLKNNTCNYLIVTESLPIGNFISNIDKINGSYTRVLINSGVVLEDEPFCMKFKSKTNLLEVQEYDAIIRSILYEL
jgi:2-polyprenyl-3-methyl-5-hydroxy-6-metoxy-1,4-benzoquinol methylase